MNSNSDTSFAEFLQTCRTFDPASEEPCPVPDWKYIQRLADNLTRQDRILIVKSRQMMVTWIGCAYMLFRAFTGGPGIHLVVSKEERSAKELITRIAFLLAYRDCDENEEQVKLQSTQISFPQRSSRIVSLPASPYAVRGISPKTVFWDEMAFTPNDEEIWAAIKPAVDAGGQFLGVSTPNGPSGVFARLVHGGEKGFAVHRFHYRENPNRNSEWEDRARAGLSEARWRREQELSFEGAEGRVFDQFESRTHILASSFKLSRKLDYTLYRGIDFGYRHPAVIWAERDPEGNLTVFDCIVGDKWPIHQLVSEIRRIDKRHGISESDIRWTAVDPAGAAKSDEGISPVEHLEAAGFKILHRTSSIAAGIEVLRALLLDAGGNVRLHVHKRCEPLIRAFHGYAWTQDGEVPLKDGVHDHPMDALRYLVVNLFATSNTIGNPFPRVAGAPSPKPQHLLSPLNSLTRK